MNHIENDRKHEMALGMLIIVSEFDISQCRRGLIK